MKTSQMILAGMIGVLLIVTVFAADVIPERLDLQDYPAMFISNDRLDVTFVVGEFAQPDDVIATTEIALSLRAALEEYLEEGGARHFEVDIRGDTYEELKNLYMDVFTKKTTTAAQTILDTSLDRESIIDKNLIVVGGPCVNWVAAYVEQYPENCANSFLPGRGYIRLYPNGRGIIMVVAGYSADDTMNAAQILAKYDDYQANFVGKSFRVSSAVINQLRIT